MHLFKFRDVSLTALVECRGSQNKDRGVDEEGEHQRDRRIDGGELSRLALLLDAIAEAAGLHNTGMQIKIVRHHGGAKNTEREIKHLRVSDDFGRRSKTPD